MSMISNHQENSVDYKKTEEHGVVFSFGSNFDQKRQASKNLWEGLQENDYFSQPPIKISWNSTWILDS